MRVRAFGSKTILFVIGLTLISAVCIAQPRTGAAEDSLSLSVMIQSRHIPHFEVCIPVKVNEPFRVVWGDEKIRDSIAGVLLPPEGEEYPISLEISEGGGSCREMTKPKLKLGELRKWDNLVSSAFNHIDGRKVVLSKGSCK